MKLPICKKKCLIKSQQDSKKVTEDGAKLMPVMFFLHFAAQKIESLFLCFIGCSLDTYIFMWQ